MFIDDNGRNKGWPADKIAKVICKDIQCTEHFSIKATLPAKFPGINNFSINFGEVLGSIIIKALDFRIYGWVKKNILGSI